ncbi:hypothetical protein Achl_4372 (plasmid) [Pseudarthrobacter chlorophenolicus A6]|uniref:Uncharacterized protein n=1 Tax=Pseudarthrobacter chlorophenolicus (strain ATCC 700700 / DSM 12829 / CIP 107037 / JCM 12360 / KCTC 9906 / NCIMB 13794 / A6) TaxID=452863 RepID=B8HIS6_PSECP|nr:hypothetical protein [Pseudarthrobacter chlorophenolicus]ACL42323.1 hypothetical protein Achl_4372 [Pseudarthrobacter chlorophenolicus A6]SDQ16493.1 hypothetical protein SAMN04489738_0429 [Pseudarthrobacter chlorophenolicus]
MSDSLQTIVDLHTAATPGPHHVEVIDDHLGRHDSKQWLIPGLASERYGRNNVSFGEDERTARFVAAAFTVVPAMAARLQKVEEILASMEDLLEHGAVISCDFSQVTEELRKALEMEGPQ